MVSKVFPKNKRIVNEKLLEAIRQMPCCICGKKPSDPSHIKTVKTGGNDESWNIFPKCRSHHIEWHSVSHREFCNRYPSFEILLIKNGWEWIGNKLFHK